MNLEFYRGDFKGKKKILKVLSDFVLNRLDISVFANTYHCILCEELHNQIRPKEDTIEGLYLPEIEGITTEMKN